MSTVLSPILNSKIKVRWQEPYTSEALNKALAVLPAGIHYGFVPSGAASLTLNLDTDPNIGTSMLVVRDSTDNLITTLTESAQVVLDLTAHASTTVYIGVAITYGVSATTSGEYRAYTQAEYDAGLGDVVLLCQVDVPASGVISSAADINYIADYAWKSSGTMPGSSEWVPFDEFTEYELDDARAYFVEVGDAGDESITMVAGDESPYAVAFNAGDTGTPSGPLSFNPLRGGFLRMDPGSRGLVSFRMRLVKGEAANIAGDGAGLFIAFYDEDFVGVGVLQLGEESAFSVAATTAWQDYEYGFIAPAGTRYMLWAPNAVNITGGVLNQVQIEKIDGYVETAGMLKSSGKIGGSPMITGLTLLRANDPTFAVAAKFFVDGSGMGVRRGGPTYLAINLGEDGSTADSEWNFNNLALKSAAAVGILARTEIRTPDVEFGDTGGNADALAVKSVMTFEGQPNDWNGGTPVYVQDAPGTQTWRALEIPVSGSIRLRIPHHILPNGCIIVRVELGVENAGSANWDVDYRVVDEFSGNITTTSTLTSGTAQSGAGNIRLVDSGAISIATGAAGTIQLIDIEHAALTIRNVYWIRFTYEVDKLSEALGAI